MCCCFSRNFFAFHIVVLSFFFFLFMSFFFFFSSRRRHTRYIGDWSSDVCSSDLINRFGYVSELRKMGAHIELYNSCLGGAECRFTTLANPHSAVIFGPSKLKGATINIPDLRAGFVYLIAAALAEGESTITGIHHVERGYEHIERKLRGLGVDIERIEV